MFAIVRTGGKQYRVAAGDKIAVEKLPGVAGDKVSLDDVLLAGDGGEIKDAKGLARFGRDHCAGPHRKGDRVQEASSA
jgi:large subunit ribosomal protein L21